MRAAKINFLIGIASFLTLISADALAKEFELTLWDNSPEGVDGFFEQYRANTVCRVKIADSAIVPNAFIEVTDPALLRFDCSVTGGLETYGFSFGSEVTEPDVWSGGNTANYTFGLLFNAQGEPGRFAAVGGGGEDGFVDMTGRTSAVGAPFLVFTLDANRGDPPAVLLEPTMIGAVERPKGYIVNRASLLPPDAKAALLNGEFRFFEGFYDKNGNNIPTPVGYRGESTFDNRLAIPRVQVTQGPLPNVGEEDIVDKLVKDRRTAIVVQPRIPEGIGQVSIDLYVNNVITQTKFAGPEDEAIVFYETFDSVGDANIKVDIDPFGVFSEQFSVEYDSRDEDKYSVIETVSLALAYLFLSPDFCLSQPQACPPISPTTIRSKAIDANRFFRNVYPISDDGLRLLYGGIESVGDSVADYGLTNSTPPSREAILNNLPSGHRLEVVNGIDYQVVPATGSACPFDTYVDTRFLGDWALAGSVLQKRANQPRDRGVVFVPDNYFTTYLKRLNNGQLVGIEGVTGLAPGGPIVFATISGGGANVTHELGHTYSLPLEINDPDGNNEEYEVDVNCRPASGKRGPDGLIGFNVYGGANISDARSFMGAGPDAGEVGKLFWVSDENWNHLTGELSVSGEDPVLAQIAFYLGQKTGVASILPWFQIEGVPGAFDRGDYVIRASDSHGNILFEGNYEPNFSVQMELLGPISVGLIPVFASIPYDERVTSVELRSPNNDVLFSIDPVGKILRDTFNEIPSVCYNSQSHLASVSGVISEIELKISAGLYAEAGDTAASLRSVLEGAIRATCDFGGTRLAGILKNPKNYLLDLASSTSRRLQARVAQPALRGDLDRDGDVDRDDLNILLASRNQPASGSDDPKDLDGDGQITSLDGRVLTQLCTRPRCATE